MVDAATIDIWILIQDDNLSPVQIPIAELKSANSIQELSSSASVVYDNSQTLSALDFSDNNATFYHKRSIDLSSYSTGDVVYLRNILNDGSQPMDIEIPSENSSVIITSIFVLQIL